MSEAQVVRFEVEDGIGVITVDNPPVNALGPGVREGIIDARRARATPIPHVKAMVLIGAGRSFIAGADIRQFGKPRSAATARRSTDVLDDSAEAGRRGDPRLCAGRRARARARLPLPDRRAERQGRPARGADRHPAGRRRHAAPAAADRPEGGDGDDRERPPRAGGRGEEARHHRRDRGRKGPARRGDPLCAKASPTNARCRACATRPTVSPKRKRIPACSRRCASRSRARRATRRRRITASRRGGGDDAAVRGRLQTERRLFAELENADEAKALRYAFFAEREVAKIPGAPKDLEAAAREDARRSSAPARWAAASRCASPISAFR